MTNHPPEFYTLHNILSVFKKYNIVCDVTMDGEIMLFGFSKMDVPFKDELIAAGATHDFGYGCRVLWPSQE